MALGGRVLIGGSLIDDTNCDVAPFRELLRKTIKLETFPCMCSHPNSIEVDDIEVGRSCQSLTASSGIAVEDFNRARAEEVFKYPIAPHPLHDRQRTDDKRPTRSRLVHSHNRVGRPQGRERL